MATHFRHLQTGTLTDAPFTELSSYARQGLYVCRLNHSHQDISLCALKIWIYAGRDPVPTPRQILLAVQDEVST